MSVKLSGLIPWILGASLFVSMSYVVVDFRPFFIILSVTITYFIIAEVFERRQKYYRCRHCGYFLPKEDAKISGYDSEQTLRHIHCPKCGKIVAYSPF